MFRKIYLFCFVVLLVSCGKDVVITEGPEIPFEFDETFEVNLLGFTTNQDRDYIANSKILIDGETITSDESAFFYIDKVLVGRKGKIIQFQNEGYLPTVSRVVNHNSLEQVVLNLDMVNEAEPMTISPAGGIVSDENGSLIINNNAIDASANFVFRSFVGESVNTGNEDQLYFGSKTEFLLKAASFYVAGSAPLNTNADLEIQVNASALTNSNVSDLAVFQFDEDELTWKQRDIQISKSGNKVSFSINEYGWWTIAEKVAAKYATLELIQSDDLAISTAEVNISYDGEVNQGSSLYTSTLGSVSTYFPINRSITTSLNDGQYIDEFTAGFTDTDDKGIIKFNEEVQVPFDAKVYSCDFTFSEGFVAVISDGQHKFLEIGDGIVNGESFADDSDIILRFYNKDFQLSNSRESDIETLKSENVSFLSCDDLEDNLVVTNGSSLIEDFDKCRVKVRPIETVVIGERENDDVFLVSFEGDEEGVYEGLLFFFPEIIDDIKSEVEINIVLYDKEDNKVGGFIKTQYISTGEELKISFIGNIE